jgi:hypothetical protein
MTPSFPGYYSLEDRLATFESFWESGVARFGEENAQGWAQVIKNKKDILVQDEDSAENSAQWVLNR